jgi:hypothetical protein
VTRDHAKLTVFAPADELVVDVYRETPSVAERFVQSLESKA